MKNIFLSLALLLVANVGYATINGNAKYSVTIVNLTKGQPLTPAVIAIHQRGFQLYSLGEEASEGLKLQAKDGVTADLVSELASNKKVVSTASSSGILLPGQQTVVEVRAHPRSRISLTSMLARTNDAFVGRKNLILPRKKGVTYVYPLHIYDAGAEENTELCEHIPAPPCNSHNAETEGNEGFVHDHPGIQSIGDLNALRDAFGAIGAKVIIQKL